MANILNGFLNNLGNGATNPRGTLGDYKHASRLYVDSAFRLAPKTKYLYHVVFNLSPAATNVIPQLKLRHVNEINLLVKSIDLPKYNIATTTKNQYNRKKNVQTSIEYDPVNIAFHDDNLGITTTLMEAYYRYMFKDGNYSKEGISPEFASRNTYAGEQFHKYRYGLDNNKLVPFFDSITVYQLSRKEYIGYQLVNPTVTGFQHDSMDQSDSQGLSQNQMTVAYEAVFYSRGPVSEDSPAGFATDHYDKTPSNLSIAGGGTQSLLGQGGVLGSISDVANELASGEASLSTALKAVNTFQNAKNLSAEGLRQEGLSVFTSAIEQSARQSVNGTPNSTFPKNTGDGAFNSVVQAVGGAVDKSINYYETKVQQARDNAGLE